MLVAGRVPADVQQLPRLRSRKSSGRSAEDILDDVDGQAVLVGDRRQALTVSPERHEVLDFDLRPAEHGRTPPESRVDDHVGRGREVVPVESRGVAVSVPVDALEVVLEDVARWRSGDLERARRTRRPSSRRAPRRR